MYGKHLAFQDNKYLIKFVSFIKFEVLTKEDYFGGKYIPNLITKVQLLKFPQPPNSKLLKRYFKSICVTNLFQPIQILTLKIHQMVYSQDANFNKDENCQRQRWKTNIARVCNCPVFTQFGQPESLWPFGPIDLSKRCSCGWSEASEVYIWQMCCGHKMKLKVPINSNSKMC